MVRLWYISYIYYGVYELKKYRYYTPIYDNIVLFE